MRITDFGRFRWYENLYCWNGKDGKCARREVYDSYKHHLYSYCEECGRHWEWNYEAQKWEEKGDGLS